MGSKKKGKAAAPKTQPYTRGPYTREQLQQAYEDGHADASERSKKVLFGAAIGAGIGAGLGASVAENPDHVKELVTGIGKQLSESIREDERAKIVRYLNHVYERSPKTSRLAAVLAQHIKAKVHLAAGNARAAADAATESAPPPPAPTPSPASASTPKRKPRP